jgi:uncharacterized membrane protein required for colicin V production
MNGLDYIVIAAIAMGTLWGLVQGALRMVTSVVAVGAGLYFATAYYGMVATAVESQFGVGPRSAMIIAYLMVLIMVFSAVMIAGTGFIQLLRRAHLGWLDRLAGGATGFFLLAMLSGLGVMVVTVMTPPDAPILHDSKLTPVLLGLNEKLIGLIPPEAKASYERNRDLLIKYWFEEAMKNRGATAASPPAAPVAKASPVATASPAAAKQSPPPPEPDPDAPAVPNPY